MKISKRKTVLQILSFPISIIVLGIIGLLLMAVVYCIPASYMQKGLEESAIIIEDEGARPYMMSSESSALDNFTDALMMLTAGHDSADENAWSASMKCGRDKAEDLAPDETLVYIYKDKGKDCFNVEYPRYWHGYLLFLKPLLCFFNYGNIRYIMMFIQMGLFSVLIIKLAQKDKRLIMPVILAWIFMNPVATMMSLQYNAVTVITFASMIMMLVLSEKLGNNKFGGYRWNMFFLLAGAVTSFFDLLTFPIVVLGLMLLTYVGIFDRKTEKRKKLYRFLITILLLSCSWIFGYLGMWIMKWTIGSIITGENIFRNAIEQLGFRTSSEWGEIRISFIEVIKRQFDMLPQRIWLIIIIVLIIFFVIYIVRYRNFKLNLLVINALIAAYPFVWYLITKNHSFIHSFFTYRELAVVVFSLSEFVALHKSDGRVLGTA